MRQPLALCAIALLLGCPKEVPTNLAGSDDAQMDSLSAQLEELRSRRDLQCDQWCSLKEKVCRLSKKSCNLAATQPHRNDFQSQCVSSQEDCAKFVEACVNCEKG